MNKKTHQALTALIEKAEKLKRFNLDDHISDIGLGFHGQQDDETGMFLIEFDLPDEEKRDASLLTLRLFTQHNEQFSFPQLKKIAADTGLSDELRGFLIDVRKFYYDFLNGYPEIIKPGFFEGGTHPNRMEIFDVVLNGAIAHTRDVNKRKKYGHWARDDIRENVLLQEFSRIVQVLIKMISLLEEKCKQELDSYSDGDSS